MATLHLTPFVVQAVAQDVRNGVPLESAAAKVGVSDTTLDDWLSVGRGQPDWRSGSAVDPASRALCEDLVASVARARLELEAELAESVMSVAREGRREDMARLKAQTWFLERRYAQRWGQQVQVKATADHRVLIAELPPMTPDEARMLGRGGNGSGGD